jgi:hypothetical protein
VISRKRKCRSVSFTCSHRDNVGVMVTLSSSLSLSLSMLLLLLH